jgi:acetyl/propionyl-CoA carboxylase alpha subunit
MKTPTTWFSSLTKKISWFSDDIQRRQEVYGYMTSLLGQTTKEKVTNILSGIGKYPLSPASWNTASIIARWHGLERRPSSPYFLTPWEIRDRQKEVENYPNKFWSTYLDHFWNHYIAIHEDPKTKWHISDIIRECFSGELIHDPAKPSWAISIGKVNIGNVRYLFVGHDKNFNQWRARVEDHKAVIDILSDKRQNEYDKVVFFVDTPGADSGKDANEGHQAAIMSEVITRVSTLNKPSITLLTWEGWSGGAEVFFWTDLQIALENAYLWTIHPIGHSAIKKWAHSPKEIAYMLGLDAPHLHKRGVVDCISSLSLRRDDNPSSLLIREQLTQVIEAGFAEVEWFISDSETDRLFLRWLRLRQRWANMLLPRTSEIQEMQKLIDSTKKYERDGVKKSFDTIVKVDRKTQDIDSGILDFFIKEFESSNLTKFNILEAIDTLIQYVWSESFVTKLTSKNHNEFIGFIREELYHFQSFFWTLSSLIHPGNYDRFFSTSGTHKDGRLISDNSGLRYEKDQIEKFMYEIFSSTPPHHVHSSFETWKKTHFSWVANVLETRKDLLIDLTKKFKQVHYDLPDTIVSLALLLEEKFIASLGDDYDSILTSTDTLPIDFHAKSNYESIRHYDWLRKQIFWKCSFDEIRRKFFSSHTPYTDRFSRVATTALQDPKELEKNSQSSVGIGFGRIGYNLEIYGKEKEWRAIDQLFGIIMMDTSIGWGSVDGAAAANVIKLLEESAHRQVPVIMFLQSSGMFVDGWPEAVSSMTAMNFAIAEYFRKTAWNPKCQIFSVPLWVCTGGTIASFAQAPWVRVLPLSLTDIPFAGRIVTLDQLPLSVTLADLQTWKWNIAGIVWNPFISESQISDIYTDLNKRGINVNIPTRDLISYLSEYLEIPINEFSWLWNQNTNGEIVRNNKELFHPYKKVAILNRWVIATKAVRVLEKSWIDYTVFTTAADKDLPYVKRAAQKWKVNNIHDYMWGEFAIIQAIKDSGCDAVYLGYGFWSERDSFIHLCEKNGIVVIWPNSNNVKRMGDKIQARQTFKSVLNQVESSENEREKYAPAKWSDDILGGEGILENEDIAIDVANKIGYPVMIKAVYGGGGKWIRRVESDSDLRSKFASMSREATESFGNGSMYMEKALDNQRHVEVQIFTDSHGNWLSLGVRDCTTQRNRQKIIEETWDLGIDKDSLARLQDIAIAVAKNIGYVGAGTFEFLYDEELGKFTFMEMNTRIQVEHTITEQLVKSVYDKRINLVDLQFKIAAGWTHKIFETENSKKLIEKVRDTKNHVMEVRICAEDPAKWFAWVSMAKIKSWSLSLPKHLKKKVRFETYLSSDIGINHTSKYDSMIGQLIVSWWNREESRKNMIEALESLSIEWIPTNQEFALRILQSDAFRDQKLRISSMDSQPGEFFDWLTPYNKAIESVSELREDSIIIEEGEYVVRMNQDAKIGSIPVAGTEFSTDEYGAELLEINVNKANRIINPIDIQWDGFYIKDYTNQKLTLPPGKYTIVAKDLGIKEKWTSIRGKAVMVIRPIV